MGNSLLHKCWTCGEQHAIRFGTDGRGNVVETRDRCACERGAPVQLNLLELEPDERIEDRKDLARKTGECMDCGAPVEGRTGWALRCAAHKAEAKRIQVRRSGQSLREERNRRQLERWHSDPEFRARKMARKQELHRQRMQDDPEYRERYRKRRQRETLYSNPNRKKYLATQRRLNRKRRKQKLAWMKERYNVYTEGFTPACEVCSEGIPWNGRGRPAKYHGWCSPYRSGVARQRAWDAHVGGQRTDDQEAA